MLPYSLIALVVAFIATWLSFNNLREEIIAILRTIIALISMFISCFLAPLVIQFLVVIVAWWGIKSICRRSNC